MSMRRGAWIAGIALAGLLLAGCGGAPVDQAAAGSGTATTSPATDVTPTGSPLTETVPTTPETETRSGATTRSQVEKPAVTVPRLPIGGSGQNGEFEQCVSVRYLGGDTGNPIPDGVRVAVTGVSLTPPLLEVGGSACSPEEEPCLGSGFEFVAGEDPGTCFVPVRGTGQRADDDENAPERSVTLAVAGRIVCPAGEDRLCDDFAGRVAKDDQTIDLGIRISEAVETSTSSSASSSAAGTSASEEATTSSGSSGTPTD